MLNIWRHLNNSNDTKEKKCIEHSGAAKGGGNRAFAPLGLRQALGRECTHQADQGENGNLQL